MEGVDRMRSEMHPPTDSRCACASRVQRAVVCFARAGRIVHERAGVRCDNGKKGAGKSTNEAPV
jgi:hypothetical protein